MVVVVVYMAMVDEIVVDVTSVAVVEYMILVVVVVAVVSERLVHSLETYDCYYDKPLNLYYSSHHYLDEL